MKITALLSLSLLSSVSYAELTAAEKKDIQQLIQAFKTNNVNVISQQVNYPLKRDQPLPAIQNASEMLKWFDQVFDAPFRQSIAASSLEDWQEVGWRGIMFKRGEMWLRSKADAPNEPLKIMVVNYSGAAEQKLRQHLLTQQKNKLHPSMRAFSEPKLVFKTQHYLVRIDELSNGQMRYAAWKHPFDVSSKPELVLNKGELRVEGTARNESYYFKSGPYRYEINYFRVGEKSNPPINLAVYKNDKIILNESGHLIEE
ncbi:hypothetical protein A3K93_12610 [Acinetobacter sp. NCu2D-2]|uniref:hypothetical protein n=1 Tax=Acinetobacter sp. NCu2D-2 TaxID=1608473 RepID=UPI0007CDBC41|nr:hypothetical protein [Acinetobacter sp. NCu2D-2]ANF83192.1 hypothetical protein A3K93_12610 [Acinetobacter sp. NCu2D-2]